MPTFKQVVIWGHPLHSHTHSYIHMAFYKVFEHMGYETFWVDDQAGHADLVVPGTLVITEGQVDKQLPRVKGAYYVLHNCDGTTYQEVLPESMGLQVYSTVYLNSVPHAESINHYTYLFPSGQGYGCLFQPWGTDLLPEEIDLDLAVPKRSPVVNWVGSYGGGVYGNEKELVGFIRACKSRNIPFTQHTKVSSGENARLIRESYLAPAIVGTVQLEIGYIPCRIFKNISYGQFGFTNSSAVDDVLEGTLVASQDTYQLFSDAEPSREDHAKIREQMKLVKAKHTTLHRVQQILRCFEQ